MTRSDVEEFAAAAAALLVGILDHETGLQLLFLVVHLGADQEQRGLGIDQQLHALGLDDLVHRLLAVGELERVGKARAAAEREPRAPPSAPTTSSIGCWLSANSSV